jgi:hypothetical protein
LLLLQPPEVLREGRMSPAMDIYGEQRLSLCPDERLFIFTI